MASRSVGPFPEVLLFRLRWPTGWLACRLAWHGGPFRRVGFWHGLEWRRCVWVWLRGWETPPGGDFGAPPRLTPALRPIGDGGATAGPARPEPRRPGSARSQAASRRPRAGRRRTKGMTRRAKAGNPCPPADFPYMRTILGSDSIPVSPTQVLPAAMSSHPSDSDAIARTRIC